MTRNPKAAKGKLKAAESALNANYDAEVKRFKAAGGRGRMPETKRYLRLNDAVLAAEREVKANSRFPRLAAVRRGPSAMAAETARRRWGG